MSRSPVPFALISMLPRSPACLFMSFGPVLVASSAVPNDALAKSTDGADSAESVEHTQQTGTGTLFTGLFEDIKHLPSLPNLYIAVGGGALAFAVHPADSSVNATLRSHVTLAENLWKPGHIVGADYVEISGAAATFALGKIFHSPKTSHVGMDMLRAEIVAEGITEILKYSVQRERPDLSDNLSFPSGHSAGTFAIATVIERHLGWKMAVLSTRSPPMSRHRGFMTTSIT